MWRRYIFGCAARLVSAEGASLVETQTTALFGDITLLAKQMQEAIGQDASSMEEVMQRVQVPFCSTNATSICHVTPPFCRMQRLENRGQSLRGGACFAASGGGREGGRHDGDSGHSTSSGPRGNCFWQLPSRYRDTHRLRISSPHSWLNEVPETFPFLYLCSVES